MKLGEKHDRGPKMDNTKHKLLSSPRKESVVAEVGTIRMWRRPRSCVMWQNKCMQCQDLLWCRWIMKLGGKQNRGPTMGHTKYELLVPPKEGILCWLKWGP